MKRYSDVILGKSYFTQVAHRYECVIVVDVLPLNNNGERRFVVACVSNGRRLVKPRLAVSLYDRNPRAEIKEDKPITEEDEAQACASARFRNPKHKLPPKGE